MTDFYELVALVVVVAYLVLPSVLIWLAYRAIRRDLEDLRTELRHGVYGDRLNDIEGRLDNISEVLDVEGYYERTAEINEDRAQHGLEPL